jgi:hypothetical protein
MVDVSRLPAEQGIAVARLDGAAQRLARGRYDLGEPPGDPVSALRRISPDPTLLGLAAGRLSLQEWQAAAVDLLRAAGADMGIAAEHAASIRARQARRGGGPCL